MAITFNCSCGRVITVKDEYAGKMGKCPACKQVVQVPMPEAPEPAAIEEPAEASGPEEEPARAMSTGETKACRSCHKKIARAAVFCVHCGTDLRTGKKLTSEPEGEAEYDIMKTAPDMVTKPMDAVSTIMEAPATAKNFQKALILFAIGTAVFTYAVAQTAPPDGNAPSWWMFLLIAGLAVVVTVAWGIVAGITGALFSQTGIGFANIFMAVIAGRAVLGLATILSVLLVFALPGSPEFARYTTLILRCLGGVGLMYVITLRAYDCGHPAAFISGFVSFAVEAIIFWLSGLAFGHFILDKTLTLI